jgi:hypothetical protein
VRLDSSHRVLLLLLAVSVLTGCAAKRQASGDPRAGLLLTYRMPEDRTLRYRSATEQTLTVASMGRTGIRSDRTVEFSLETEASSADEQRLKVTVDAMNVRFDTPRGEMSREVDEVVGKSFGMVLTPQGEQPTPSDAWKLRYSLAMTDQQSLDSDFHGFFPSLPSVPVEVGATWTSGDTLKDDAFGSPTLFMIESVNTLVGIETVDGMKCAKITSTISGGLEDGRSDHVQGSSVIDGKIDGTGVWYFAYKEGLLVQRSASLRASGRMTTGVGGMPRHMARELKIDSRLLP